MLHIAVFSVRCFQTKPLSLSALVRVSHWRLRQQCFYSALFLLLLLLYNHSERWLGMFKAWHSRAFAGIFSSISIWHASRWDCLDGYIVSFRNAIVRLLLLTLTFTLLNCPSDPGGIGVCSVKNCLWTFLWSVPACQTCLGCSFVC